MAYNCIATFEKSTCQGRPTYKPKIITDFWYRTFDVDYASLDCALGYAREECEQLERVHKLSNQTNESEVNDDRIF
jgi:hypothetical protein